MAHAPDARSPFFVLWRAFFAQFFTSESVTSDVHLRKTIVWVLAFLLPPGVFLMILMFPEFQAAVIRAKFLRGPASYVDDLLIWIAVLFTTYSMVSTGFITVLAWDALTFDRRNGIVLGGLPLKPGTILGAKLAALGSFVLAGSISINLLNAAVFALETSDQAGGAVLITHFLSFLCATVGAGVFISAALVMVRAVVGLLGGPGLASACGPPLQFLFIVGLLCLLIFCPFVLHLSFGSAAFTNALPSVWFAGLFERLRGSPRATDPMFMVVNRRALIATPIAILGALIVSVAEFRRHMRLAVASPARPGVLGGAAISRKLARLILGRNPVARATSEFILLTLARHHAQQMPIAINAALGAAVVVAALSFTTRHLDLIMRLRTAVLWIPLVMGYWMTVGLRASFFVPSELPASWAFRANAPDSVKAHWLAVRASMMAFLVPRTLIIAALLVPFLGWRVAATNGLIASGLVILLVEVAVLTIDFIPFTRAYQPGHAKLKTRWWVYAIGLCVFAYWPARFELWALKRPSSLLGMLACIMVPITILELMGRRDAGNRSVHFNEEDEDDSTGATVLHLSGFMQGAQSGR